jgi:hypothetical protein
VNLPLASRDSPARILARLQRYEKRFPKRRIGFRRLGMVAAHRPDSRLIVRQRSGQDANASNKVMRGAQGIVSALGSFNTIQPATDLLDNGVDAGVVNTSNAKRGTGDVFRRMGFLLHVSGAGLCHQHAVEYFELVAAALPASRPAPVHPGVAG